jgi:hypothetical protein
LIPGQLGGGNFAKLAAFPGYFKWQDRNVVIRTTGENLRYLVNNWPQAEWIGGSSEVRDQYLEGLGVARETAQQKVMDVILPSPEDYHFFRDPMDHQRKAFNLSWNKKVFGLFMEQGTGKTKVILDTAACLYGKGEIEALVIVAWPNLVHQNWIEYEAPLDLGCPWVAYGWNSADAGTRRARVACHKVFLSKGRLRIFAFNVEAFVGETARDMMLEILQTFRCLLVIDQSASIKNPQAKRTKFLIDKCSQLATYRRILDGEPVAEGAEELYAQFKFLDPWIIGHDTWTGFKAEFCITGWWNEIAGYKNLEELHRRIDGHCYRVLEKDCQDLPERIYKPFIFDLGTDEQRVFDELRSVEIAQFCVEDCGKNEEGKPGETENLGETIEEHRALIKNLRLQQISSGWWPGEDFKAISKVPSRLEALLSLLKSIKSQKALIFSRFRADLAIIQSVLGPESAVSFHGGIGEKDRLEAKRRFMRDPKTLYFIGQPRSAGLGHTLTEARHVIFYANDHSLRLRVECEKRAHRQGLRHKLLVWDLIAKGTQDLNIVKSLREKKQVAGAILRDPESFFLQYEP